MLILLLTKQGLGQGTLIKGVLRGFAEGLKQRREAPVFRLGGLRRFHSSGNRGPL